MRSEFWWRPVAMCVTAPLVYVLAEDPVRRFESRTVFGLAAALSDRVDVSADQQYVMLRTPYGPASVAFSGSCSSLLLIATLTALALFAVRARPARRIVALAAASAVAVILNAFRTVGMIYTGAIAGRTPMIALHDWVGTPFTIVSGVLAVITLFTLAVRRDHEDPDRAPADPGGATGAEASVV